MTRSRGAVDGVPASRASGRGDVPKQAGLDCRRRWTELHAAWPAGDRWADKRKRFGGTGKAR